MIEKQRQVIMFGNFSSISLNDVSKCNEINKPNVILDLAPDMVTGINQIVTMRPILITENTQLFIGSERIYFQEIDARTENYDEFLKKALELFNILITNFKILPHRLACNGIFTNLPNEAIVKVKDLIFKEAILGTQTDITDWNFSINHQVVPSGNFPTIVNQVITSTSNATAISSDGQESTEPLVFGYDCNTDKANPNSFSIEDCRNFTILSKKFRQVVFDIL